MAEATTPPFLSLHSHILLPGPTLHFVYSSSPLACQFIQTLTETEPKNLPHLLPNKPSSCMEGKGKEMSVGRVGGVVSEWEGDEMTQQCNAGLCCCYYLADKGILALAPSVSLPCCFLSLWIHHQRFNSNSIHWCLRFSSLLSFHAPPTPNLLTHLSWIISLCC